MAIQIHNRKKGAALRVINALISVLHFPARIFSKTPDLAKLTPQKILLLRLDHIGDVVMTSPAFSSIRERFPQAEIILLTDSVGQRLFDKDPRIDQVMVYNWPWVHQKKNNSFSAAKLKELFSLVRRLRHEKIDLLVDFRGDIRFIILFGILTGAKIRISNSRCGDSTLLHSSSYYDVSKHEVERSLDVLECLGCPTGDSRPRIYLREEEIASIRQKVEARTGNVFPPKLAVIAPYSSKDVKSWPAHYFRELISSLTADGFSVIIAGTKDDREHARAMISGISGQVYSFAGETSIRELGALVSIASIVVGVDTGVLHIAACFNVPVIAIFGATRSVEFRPYSPFARVLETNTCRCNQFLHDKCDYPVDGYAECLATLKPSQVLQAIAEIKLNPTISA